MDAVASQKVTIIDDSNLSIKIIANILEDSPFTVDKTYTDSLLALTEFNESEKRIYIIDVVMPGLNGIELTKKMTKKSPQTQVIMISSLASESLVLDSITAGAIDFIQKPFSKNRIMDSLQRASENIEANK